MKTSDQKTKKSTRIYLLLSAAVLFIAAGIFMYEYAAKEYQIQKAAQDNLDLQDEIVNDSDLFDDVGDLSLISDSHAKEQYISPIDFETLRSKNSDSVAWMVIQNADMSFPVMCHEGDNTYYLNRNFDNEWSVYGAAYIEDYNSVDFSDTAVVVYGHNEHLLESYDFDSPRDYNRFINEAVSSRTVNGITDKDEIPETGTPLLILSSCLKGDSTHRFLVLAYQCQ